MTDPRLKKSKPPPNVNREAFAQFLEHLSPDPKEAGRHYTCLYKKITGFFHMKGDPDPLSAADATIDRAALKISAGAVVPDVDRYCLGIARNIFKERLRLRQRENSAFHKFFEDLSNPPAEEVERIQSILKPCFEQLAVEEQQLLLAYYQEIQGRTRAQHRCELAEEMNITVLALRLRVSRLRDTLRNYVKKRSKMV